MKVIDGDGVGLRVRVYKKLFGKYVIEVGKEIFALPDDLAKVKVLHKEENASFFWRITLGIFATQKSRNVTVGVQTKSGKRFVFVTDNAAWKEIKQYVGIGTMQEW